MCRPRCGTRRSISRIPRRQWAHAVSVSRRSAPGSAPCLRPSPTRSATISTVAFPSRRTSSWRRSRRGGECTTFLLPTFRKGCAYHLAVLPDGSIFISYRRDDSAGQAGRLYDRLCEHFGKERVFIDVDTIRPGEDFVHVLDARVSS